jgi:hypothetical protein
LLTLVLLILTTVLIGATPASAGSIVDELKSEVTARAPLPPGTTVTGTGPVDNGGYIAYAQWEAPLGIGNTPRRIKSLAAATKGVTWDAPQCPGVTFCSMRGTFKSQGKTYYTLLVLNRGDYAHMRFYVEFIASNKRPQLGD